MLQELRSSLQKIPYNLKLVLAVIMLGLVSGIFGILLHYLLELVEGIAFGQTEHYRWILDRWCCLITNRLQFNHRGCQFCLGLVFLAKKSKDFFHQSADER